MSQPSNFPITKLLVLLFRQKWKWRLDNSRRYNVKREGFNCLKRISENVATFSKINLKQDITSCVYLDLFWNWEESKKVVAGKGTNNICSQWMVV